MDFFCAIRYYKGNGEKKTALKFDYYMLRTIFGKDTLEVQVFHERGPRYVSPEDLTMFVFNRINEASNRKVLKTSKTFISVKRQLYVSIAETYISHTLYLRKGTI